MLAKPIKTRRFVPPKDSLVDLLGYLDGHIKEGSIVAISSKVLGICEGDCVPIDLVEKEVIRKHEADRVLSYTKNNTILLTKKGDMLLEYGGVDNLKDGYYVTLPKHPYRSAREIWKFLRKKYKVRKLGVVITDSHSVPFRKGAIGLAIAGYGFKPVTKSYAIGTKRISAMADVLDGVAATANLVMGEALNSTPLAVVYDIPGVVYFTKALPGSVVRSYMYVRNENEVYKIIDN